MTVKELIHDLSEFNPDLEIVIFDANSGIKYGISDIYESSDGDNTEVTIDIRLSEDSNTNEME